MKHHRHRYPKAFSLILVASLGAVFLLMALAIGTTILPVFRAVGGTQPSQASSGPLEAGIQYAIAQFIYTAQKNPNTLSSLGANISVPSSLTGSQYPVTVAVTPLANKIASKLLPPYLTPVVNPQNSYSLNSFNQTPNTASQSYYQLVASTPGSGSSISVLLGPAFVTTNPNYNPTIPGQPQLNPLFPPYAAFAQQSLNLNGAVMTSMDGSKVGADLGSNGTISLAGPNNAVGGNLSAYGYQSMSLSGANGPTTVINGNVNYMGTPSSSTIGAFQTDNATAPGYNPLNPVNVLGDGVNSIQNPSSTTFGQINGPSAGSITPTTTPPIAMPTNIIPGVIQSSDQINFAVSAPPVNTTAALGAINLSGQQTMTLPPGSYTATSIDITGGASISIPMQSNSTSGVNIFVVGNSPGSNNNAQSAVNIGGKGISQTGASPSPNNFQIFYNGTENVGVFMNSNFNVFYGQIYAPNSTVNMRTFSRTAGNTYGAVVAAVANLQNINLHYNPNTVGQSSGPGSSGGSGNPNGSGSSSSTNYPATNWSATPTSFSVLSWQEISKSGAP